MDHESPCIHCGFCLPVCPTYDVLGTEMDGPRGRLMLMDGLDDGRIDASPAVLEHLDLCLGCRACETACPSGVPYGAKLTATREAFCNDPVRPLARRRLERLVLQGVALPPWLLRLGMRLAWPFVASGLLARVARWLPGRAGAALGLLAATTPATQGPPPFTAAATSRDDGRHPRVALLTGCISSALFGDVSRAAARLLAGTGCDVVVPTGQVCCGALHRHAGDRAGATRLLKRNIVAFEAAGDIDHVVVDAAGCGSALKEAHELLGDDPAWADRARRFSSSVRDALELLDELGLPPTQRAVPATVACHDACHLTHAQQLHGLSSRLLGQLPGVVLAPLPSADRCCGSAGLYSLLHPQVADALGRAKVATILDSGADVLTAANPGCLMHLARHAAPNATRRRPDGGDRWSADDNDVATGTTQRTAPQGASVGARRRAPSSASPTALHPLILLDRACSLDDDDRGAPSERRLAAASEDLTPAAHRPAASNS